MMNVNKYVVQDVKDLEEQQKMMEKIAFSVMDTEKYGSQKLIVLGSEHYIKEKNNLKHGDKNGC
jgi:hypothetical protein